MRDLCVCGVAERSNHRRGGEQGCCGYKERLGPFLGRNDHSILLGEAVIRPGGRGGAGG